MTSVWRRTGVVPVKSKHLVESVRYTKGRPADDAPMSCTCGWAGTVGEWLDHSGHSVSRTWAERPRADTKPPEPTSVKGATATHCKWGHPWTRENTYRRDGGTTRQCRQCRNERNKEYMGRSRNKVAA
jgi:hypothetical protein